MADNILELMFTADTKELDEAKEKLIDLGEHMPTVGEGIENLAKSFTSLPGPIGLAVAAAVGLGIALTEMVEHSTEAGQQLLEMSEAVGMSVEQFQPLSEALQLAGVSSEQTQKSLQKLAQTVGQALSQPTGKAAEEFRQLGISQQELAKGDINQILSDTAAGFAKYADSAEKTAAMRDLLGRQGPAIVNAMADEGEAIAKTKETLDEYGASISTADAEADKHFNGTISLSMQMFAGLANSITKSLLPGLQVLADQFAEAGKSGGAMRIILDGLSSTIGVIAKVIISGLYEPVRALVEAFKEAGTAIGATFASIAAAAHGHLDEAKQIIVQMGQDLKKMNSDYVESADKFETALWSGTDAVQEQAKAADDGKEKFTAFSAAALKVSETIQGLKDALAAQRGEMAAAAVGLDAYKKAEDDVAIAAERLKIANEGGSKAAQDQAEALMRAANAAKQGTQDELSGWNAINRLIEEQNSLVSHNTELEKARAEIAAHPEMTDAEKQELLATAQAVDAKKQELEVEKELATAKASVTKDIGQEVASMTLSTNQLKLYNEQAKLVAQYNKDAFNKTPEQVAQLTNALKQNLQTLQQNNQTTQQWTQSFQGFGAGASQALNNVYEQSMNLNTIGKNMVTTFATDMTNAFMNIGKQGTNAFAQLGIAMVQFIEQTVIKMALMKAMIVAIDALPGGAAFLSSMSAMSMLGNVTKSANGNAFSGGSVTPFASGGVVGGPTMVPMALMGEAGPEAIMPLKRGSDGKLGVAMGGGSNGGGGIISHNSTFVINSNQNPKDIAKATKKQVTQAGKFMKGTIAQQKRPGGLLNNNHNMAFAR